MQQFLEVWRNGEYWYEFPAENEDNVRMMLMRQGIDNVCTIQPKLTEPGKLTRPIVFLDLSAPEVPAKPKKSKPAKGTTNDHS